MLDSLQEVLLSCLGFAVLIIERSRVNLVVWGNHTDVLPCSEPVEER